MNSQNLPLKKELMPFKSQFKSFPFLVKISLINYKIKQIIQKIKDHQFTPETVNQKKALKF